MSNLAAEQNLPKALKVKPLHVARNYRLFARGLSSFWCNYFRAAIIDPVLGALSSYRIRSKPNPSNTPAL